MTADTADTQEDRPPSWADIFRRSGLAYGANGDALGALALARSKADPSPLHTAAVLLAAMDDNKSRPLSGAMLSRLFLAKPEAAQILTPGPASIAAFAWTSALFYDFFETWELACEAGSQRAILEGETIIAESLARFQDIAESAADFAADPLAGLAKRALLLPTPVQTQKIATLPPPAPHPLAELFDANYSTGAPHTYHIGALNAAFGAGFRIPAEWSPRGEFLDRAPLLCALRHNARALRSLCLAIMPPAGSLSVFVAQTLRRAMDALDETEAHGAASPQERLTPRAEREAAERLRSNRKSSARLLAVHLASCAEWSRTLDSQKPDSGFLSELLGPGWFEAAEPQSSQGSDFHAAPALDPCFRAFKFAASDSQRFSSFCASIALAANELLPEHKLAQTHPAWAAWPCLHGRLQAGKSRNPRRTPVTEPLLAAEFCRLSTALPDHPLAPACLAQFAQATRAEIERKLLAGISMRPAEDSEDEPARKLRL